MPKLSVILPVYNVEAYIEMCLESIVRQINNDVEVICVDDGSNDKSGVICDAYASKYNNFIVIHTANKGVGAARNIGLHLATGEYIAWCDPDDYVTDNWYVGIKKIIEENADIGIFDYSVFTDKASKIIKYGLESKFLDKENFLLDVVDDIKIQSQLWQKIFKKNLLKNIKFPENVKCMEYYAVLHELILKAENIYYLSEVLYYYRKREDGLVMAIDVGKSFACYKIALKRYSDLQNANYNISQIGYLMQAMGVCIQFAKADKKIRAMYLSKNKICRNAIRANLISILVSSVSLREKVKFCIIALGLHCFVMDIYKNEREKLDV